MLDMNCDGKICETDIFSFMEMHNNDEFFRETFLFDMQDIVRKFKEMNNDLIDNDHVWDHSNLKEPKIKELEAYLDHSKQLIARRKELHD